ncbi:sulfotransferase 1B1-like [Mya arenaria]|uniref:sulfotransferase 1B1-like n=1 Tax=Mya arenaria TaxID=6604 RepID=UPI0022E5BEF7|nr:sulfotransferase 1B1-like [Mya arenaria]
MCSILFGSGTNWLFDVLMILLRWKAERVNLNKLVTMLELHGAENVDNVRSPRVINCHLPPRGEEVKEAELLQVVMYFYALNMVNMDLTPPTWVEVMENGMKEIERLISFLEIDISDSLQRDILDMCGFQKMAADKMLIQDQDGFFNENFRFFRKGEVGDWKNWFTVEQNEYFDSEWNKQIRADTIFQFKYTQNQANS